MHHLKDNPLPKNNPSTLPPKTDAHSKTPNPWEIPPAHVSPGCNEYNRNNSKNPFRPECNAPNSVAAIAFLPLAVLQMGFAPKEIPVLCRRLSSTISLISRQRFA